jgi:hypothetical protein
VSDGACASHGLDLSLSYVAFARHETMSVLVTLINELGEIHLDLDLDLGLQGRGEHRPRKLRHRSRPDPATFRTSLVVVHFAQHRRPFLAGALMSAARCDFNEEGTSRLWMGG